MACRCAVQTDEWHGWECSITEGPCMYFMPDSKKCAEEYGEGPDASPEDVYNNYISELDEEKREAIESGERLE